MPRPLLRSAATALSVFCLTALASAGGARFWEVGTLADFLEGDVTNLSIDQHGRLTLGPELRAIADASLPYLWSAVLQPDGTLLLGSGNEGQAIRVAPDGTHTVIFDSAELEAHALAAAPEGGLYVGTSPDGRIYHVDDAGQARTFFDPDDKYIWALAVSPDGTVYAATGDKGRIYRIRADGESELFYETSASHVRALTLAPDGEVLAGTETPGRVFRIDREGRGFLLLDSGMPEISALRLGSDGMIYAAAVAAQPAGGDAPPAGNTQEPARAPIPNVSTEITVISIMDVTASTGRATPGGGRETARTSGRGAVFRIRPDGVWDQVWASGEDAPYDVVPETGGALLIATGGKGKIYRVAGDPAITTLITRVPARQVTAMLRDEKSGDLLLASANPGKVFRLGSRPAARGTYESDVLDSESVSTWGAISWRGQAPRGSSVRLFTRSGNAAAPDKTWSPWSDAYEQPEGEQVTSPKARYLQWKIELTREGDASPVVTSVTVAYLQRNQRPEITSITVHPPGVVFQKPFSTGETEIAGYDADPPGRRLAGFTANAAAAAPQNAPVPALGRRGYQKGLQTFIWKAEDANDDDLTYELSYRREGETAWKVLEPDLAEPLFVWDTTSVPNGTYVVKVAASDSAANPPGESLTAEQESGAFDIDNTPPVLEISDVTRANGGTRVRFTVVDGDSPVQHVEYSLDADRWRPIYPQDGIADSRREEFELTLDEDTTGKAIILRAMDTLNNVATTRAEPPQDR